MKKKIVTALALWLCLLVTVTTHVWAAEIETYEISSDGSVHMDYNAEAKTVRVYGNGKMDNKLWDDFKRNHKDFFDSQPFVSIESGVQFPDDSSYLFSEFDGQIDIAADIDTSNVKNMYGMFKTTAFISLDVSNWDTSNVTDMRMMFGGARSPNLDVSQWDTSNVTTMSSMFESAQSLNLDVSQWDTSNVTDMKYMFAHTRSVNLDVSQWDTSNVTNMSYMFADTSSANPDVSQWDVSKVIDIHGMFFNAQSADPDVSRWNTSNILDMSEMFSYALVANPDVSNWNISNVGSIAGIFMNAPLANPDVSKWDTANVQFMHYAFYNTPSANPDVSKWDLSSIETMNDMFYGAEKVQKIDFRNAKLTEVRDLGGLDNTKSLEEVWLSKMTAGSTDVALKGPFTIDYYDADGTIYKTEESNDQRFIISEEDAATASQIHLYLTNPIPTEPDVPEEPTSSGSWLVAPLPEPAKDKDTEVHTAYLTGYPDGTVMAEGEVTRGEAAAMVLRLAGKSLTHDDAVYHDVDANAWYSDYVLTAKALSMLDDKDGKLRPNDAITRGEFAAMLAVLDKDSTEQATFSDIDGHKYEAAIEKIAGNKRIIGYDDGTFRPDATLTRGEAVTILNRMFDRVADGVAVEDHSELKAFTDLNVTDWYYYEIVEAANTHRLERRGGIDAFGRQLENWTDVLSVDAN
ncbi:BspA family leucine-rich repeat surface protein [Peptoniphilus equinus]|uniref:BspA family leucine-rich repeat surface protein n=1 Tax=Peptoniphilus equinus TaxID=3016343 RepID=A0ABY7QSU1_9FIRM|nr:BspA family leucine-rich repeat surface protein [Peptoniphilus equinus]WBW49223.1 BspA family leucine-rich repeat surface protein [Peptoniphilus equinus]